MTQILLRNEIDSARMDALLLFLNTWGIDAEVKRAKNALQPIRNDT
jgi:hypothetical protein